MPPINQQGSRAGLVTALVVFVILFVVSAVFAFNYYGQVKQLTVNANAQKALYNGYLNEDKIQSAPVQALVTAKSEQPPHFNIVNSPAETALDVAIKQANGLSMLVNGSEVPPGTTADNITNTLKKSTAALKAAGVTVDLSAGGLLGAVDRLSNAVVEKQGLIAQDTKDKAALEGQVKELNDSIAKVNATKDEAAKTQQQAGADQLAQVQKSLDDNSTAVKAMQEAQAGAQKTTQEAQQASQTQVAEATRQLTEAQKTIVQLRDRLGKNRPDVTNAAVRVADGQIIRATGSNVCYINLGYGSGVTNGLTFEVYDKITGIPPVPANANGDEQLPIGKASIEIIHVGDNSSECRIVHQEPGAVLTEGDPVENLVFDAHQKYRFIVYGDFDLASTGRPNAADREVIKRLVTQWGGRIENRQSADGKQAVGPDDDFLVLGAEPVLPEFAKDDLTPENQDKLQKAQEALDKYQEVRQAAKDNHIPILNQNRFLYYVGYYDQAKR